MKYELSVTNQFKKSLKLCSKRGLPLDELWKIVDKLLNGEELEAKFRVHQLVGDHEGDYECHIKPDWLLIWRVYNDELILLLVDTGKHSDLFG